MGVRANHDALQRFGREFQGIPAQEPRLPAPVALGQDTPLSTGLAQASAKAFAAADFAAAKDRGLVAAGDALLRIDADLEHFDAKGRAAILGQAAEGGR